MFYVKGNALLSSLSQPSPEQTNSNARVEQQQQDDYNGHHTLSVGKSATWFPLCLFAAIVLSMFSSLYPTLVMSVVFRAQASAVSPDGKPLPPIGNNSNDNVPLVIDCPRLPPREGAKSVRDLRPDDIRLVMGIGDRYVRAIQKRTSCMCMPTSR